MAPRYTLKVLDALPGLGPVRALMAAPPSARLVADPDDAMAVKAAGEPCIHLHLAHASMGASEGLLCSSALHLCCGSCAHLDCARPPEWQFAGAREGSHKLSLPRLSRHRIRNKLQLRASWLFLNRVVAAQARSFLYCAAAIETGPPLAVAAVGNGRRGGLAVLRRNIVPLLAVEPVPIRGRVRLHACFHSIKLPLCSSA